MGSLKPSSRKLGGGESDVTFMVECGSGGKIVRKAPSESTSFRRARPEDASAVDRMFNKARERAWPLVIRSAAQIKSAGSIPGSNGACGVVCSGFRGGATTSGKRLPVKPGG